MSKPASSKKSQGRRRSRNKQPPTKVIIRHLPPNLTEESFCQTLDLPSDSYWYLTGPVSTDLGYFATSRAYITFNDMNDLLLFKDKYDGYVFVDTKGGGEYRAEVDLAPFQKIPRQKKNRKDTKVGTLEKDADYLKFVESLNAPKSESNVNTAEMYLEELENRERELKLSNGCPKVTTPLIEFILKKKKGDRSKKKYDEPRVQEDNKHRRIYTRTHRGKNDRLKTQKKPSQQNDGQSALVKKQPGNSASVSNGSAKSTESKSKKERSFEKQPGNSSANNGSAKPPESKSKKDRTFDKQPGNSATGSNGPAKSSESKAKKERTFEKKGDFGDKVKRDRRRNRNRDRDRDKEGKGEQVAKPVKLLKKGESQAAV